VRIRLLAACIAILLLTALPAAAERVSDRDNLISIEAPSGWRSIPPEDAVNSLRRLAKGELRIVGVDRDRTRVLLINSDKAHDIVPHISISIADRGGLSISDTDLGRLSRLVESVYSEAMGTRFRLLMLEKAELGGLQSVRLTGIYRWRTVNIKILQYLIPGGGRLYAVTFTAKEREFNGLLSEAESAMNTVRISDPLLLLDWLWSAVRWLILLSLIGGIIWLTMIAAGSTGGGEGTSVSRFLRKK
jgi:hypothetical protein